MGIAKRSILLVDLDQANARWMAKWLKDMGYSVLVARDGAHALSILQFRGFEVLIVDIAASKVDHLDLISWACSVYPAPRVIAMGNSVSRQVERSVLGRGAGLFLHKPVNVDQLSEFLSRSRGRSSFAGKVEGVDIIEYVQFILLGGIRTILEVTSTLGTRGRIFIAEGMVLHAACGVLQGEQALYRVLRFREGTFSHLPWEPPDQVTVNKPGEFLLMEAVRRRDDAWGDTTGGDDR